MPRAVKAHVLLILITFAWGATFVLIKSALAQVSPLVFNTLRMVIAAVALGVIFHRALPELDRDSIKGGILVGVFLWLGYAFQTTGLRLTTPSKSAFITGLAVVLVPLIVAATGKRVPNRWTIMGVVSAFVGLYLMTIPAGEGFSLASINRGDLLTFGCAVSFACHIFTTGIMTRRHGFRRISIVQVATAAVLMALIIPAETPRLILSMTSAIAILFTALICTAAAFSIQSWAQQFTPPTHTALIFALEPVFAALTSYIVLRENLGVRGMIGAFLILGGILISELRGSSVEPDRNFETSSPSDYLG